MPLLAALGGLLALDATSVGQFMISRPLVAGTLTGCFLGTPSIGLAVGATLELYALATLPSGGARLPDTTSGTVVAVACASTGGGAGTFAFAVAFGLAWGRLGGASVGWMRALNARLVSGAGVDHPMPRATGSGSEAGIAPARLDRLHLSSVFLDFLRGCVLTVAGVLLGRELVGLAGESWPVPASVTFLALLAGGAVSLGILASDLWDGRRSRRCGLVILGAAVAAIGTVVL